MTANIITILLSLAVILFSCQLFVNAVEWLGRLLKVRQGVVGSILAALGTAMPETVVPLIAILFTGTAAGMDIGMGSIIGAPFMLSTLSLCITGASVFVFTWMGRRKVKITADKKLLAKDLSFFIVFYLVAVLSSFIPGYTWHLWIGLGLLCSYAFYVRVTLVSGSFLEEKLEVLLAKKYLGLNPGMAVVVLQLLVSVGLLTAGAHFFVGALADIAASLGASPFLLSLLITPVVTELPEKFNSVIWMGRKKDTLALGNVTGSMVFQCCFPWSSACFLRPGT